MRRITPARITGGRIEPAAPLELPDGAEVELHWTDQHRANPGEGLRRSFGGWRHKVDCAALKRRLFG